MKMKTNELIGAALDYWVAKCENSDWSDDDCIVNITPGCCDEGWVFNPSSDWSQGGPIIEKEGIRMHRGVNDHWWAATDEEPQRPVTGPTPLVATMRCFVASKMGDEIKIPDELQ